MREIYKKRLLENTVSITADVFVRPDYADMRSEHDERIGGFMGWTEAISVAATVLTNIEADDVRGWDAMYGDDGDGIDWYVLTSLIADEIAREPNQNVEKLVRRVIDTYHEIAR